MSLTKRQQFKNIRARHLISFRRYLSLKGDGDAVIDFLNMNAFELREYISSQWLLGMDWENYGDLWVVDHIVPLRYFDPTNIKEMKLCWDYNNLKPNYYLDNHAKGCCIEVTVGVLNNMPKNASVKRLINKIKESKDMFLPYY